MNFNSSGGVLLDMPPRHQHPPRTAPRPVAEVARRGGEEGRRGKEATEEGEQGSQQAALRVRLVKLEHGHLHRRQLKPERRHRPQQFDWEPSQF